MSGLRVAGLAAMMLVAGCGRLIPDAAPGQATGPRPYLPSQTPVASGDNLIDRPIDGGTFGRLQRATPVWRCWRRRG